MWLRRMLLAGLLLVAVGVTASLGALGDPVANGPAQRPRDVRPDPTDAPARPARQPADIPPMPESARRARANARAEVARVRAEARNRWALLVGVSEYEGNTVDTPGSAADARALQRLLIARGWRPDQVRTLVDGDATRADVVEGLRWLAKRTDKRSTVVFSWSGHTRLDDSDPDGDGEAVDEGLWPADNDFLWDAELGRLLAPVRAKALWITIQACEAQGYGDPGVEGPGRLVSYSSKESEKSFEDIARRQSLQVLYMFGQGARAARRGSSLVVQDAYRDAKPLVRQRSDGRQTLVMVDRLGAPFDLQVS